MSGRRGRKTGRKKDGEERKRLGLNAAKYFDKSLSRLLCKKSFRSKKSPQYTHRSVHQISVTHIHNHNHIHIHSRLHIRIYIHIHISIFMFAFLFILVLPPIIFGRAFRRLRMGLVGKFKAVMVELDKYLFELIPRYALALSNHHHHHHHYHQLGKRMACGQRNMVLRYRFRE